MKHHLLATGLVAIVATINASAIAQITRDSNSATVTLSNAKLPDARNNLAAGGALQVHQNAGGDIAAWGPTSTNPNTLLRSNANLPLGADMVYWIDRDASVQVYVCAASPHTGDSVGVDWTVSGTTYHERYTVQGGDTTTLVATGIGNAINGDSALLAALAAYHNPDSGQFKSDGIGYQPYQVSVASQTSNGCTIFDAPDGVVPTAVSSGGGTTITVKGNPNAGATPALDGGPSLIVGRLVPGHAPHKGDILGQIIFQGATSAANGFGQTGQIVDMLDSTTTSVLQLGSKTAQLQVYDWGIDIGGTNGQANYLLEIDSASSYLLVGLNGGQSYLQSGAGEIQMQTNGGGLTQVAASAARLGGATSGSVTVKAPSVAGANTLTLPAGTTDFSATGGTSQVVKQTSAGGAFSVGQLGYSDISGTPSPSRITVFTTNGTYVPTSGAKITKVFGCGGGGGGGGGALEVSGTAASGGAGGGGAYCFKMQFRTSDLGASQTITIGAAGTAGVAATSNTTAGGNGGNGGETSFGSLLVGYAGGGGQGGQLLAAVSVGGGAAGYCGDAAGGSAGGAGGCGTGASGGSGTSGSQQNSPTGGAGGGGSSAAGVAGSGGATVGFMDGGGGGGAGGGVTAGAGSNNGGVSGRGPANQFPVAGGTSGTPNGTAGSATSLVIAGLGGAGGYGNGSGNAGNGGAGIQGSGGGGGGSALNGSTAGAGGAGGAGFIVIQEFF